MSVSVSRLLWGRSPRRLFPCHRWSLPYGKSDAEYLRTAETTRWACLYVPRLPTPGLCQHTRDLTTALGYMHRAKPWVLQLLIRSKARGLHVRVSSTVQKKRYSNTHSPTALAFWAAAFSQSILR